MIELAKIDPVLAEMQFRDDLKYVQKHQRCKYHEWNFTPEFDSLHLYVDLWSFDQAHTKLDDFHIVMDMSYYRTYPPGVAFVNPEFKLFDPDLDAYWFPKIARKPEGINIDYHSSYTFPSGVIKQMICNSMVLEYYQSPHSPSADERWNPAKHNFFATMSVIQTMLTKPYYGGRSG